MWTVIFLWIYVCCLLCLLSFSLFEKFFWSKMLLNKIVLHKVAIFCLKQCCYWYPMLQNWVSCVSTNFISIYFWCLLSRILNVSYRYKCNLLWFKQIPFTHVLIPYCAKGLPQGDLLCTFHILYQLA